MKKFIALLAVMMMAMSLSACGSTTTTEGSAETSAPAAVETAVETTTAETTVAETAAAVETNAVETETAFEEITLLDSDGFIVKITGIDADNIWGYTWNVYVENNTDHNVMVGFNDVAVNGCMEDPFWATEVAAGMKSNEEVTWYDDFSNYGIDTPTIFTGELSVYDEDTWDDYYRDDFTVTPDGRDNITYVSREAQAGDQVLYEDDQFRVTCIGFGTDELGDVTMQLYIENTCDADATVAIENCAVNGFMCDPFWATNVTAGNVAYSTVTWYMGDLESNGIDSLDAVESFDFTLRIYDVDTWADYAEQTVTVNP